MKTGNKFIQLLKWVGTFVLQLIMTQVVTFILSLFFPKMENVLQTQPALFAVMVGLCFSAGIFLAGWLAIKLHWISSPPKTLWRLLGTLIGVFLPLVAAVSLYRTLEPGSPAFFASIVVGILGFHLPTWWKNKASAA
jgi:hypothetical protein